MRKAGAILRLRGSCRMRRQLELATVTREPGDGGQQGQPAGDRGTAGKPLGSPAPLVGPARAGRAQRFVRAGGYSAVLALTLCKVSVERMRGPETLGPGAGGLLWTGEALFLLMMAIFTAIVSMATAQRSPVTTGTLLRGIAAGLPIGIAVFVFLPLGVVRYQASRVLPAVPQAPWEHLPGPRCWLRLRWPAFWPRAGSRPARRCRLRRVRLPGSALGWGRRSRCTGRARTARPKPRRETPRRRRRTGGWPDWRHARGVAGHRHDRLAGTTSSYLAGCTRTSVTLPHCPQNRALAAMLRVTCFSCLLSRSPVLRGGIRRRVDRYCGPGLSAGRRPPARRRSARGTTTARRRRGPQP